MVRFYGYKEGIDKINCIANISSYTCVSRYLCQVESIATVYVSTRSLDQTTKPRKHLQTKP